MTHLSSKFCVRKPGEYRLDGILGTRFVNPPKSIVVWQGDMDSESLLHNDIVRKLNSGRKLLQRMTPPSKPSVPMSPKREPPAND